MMMMSSKDGSSDDIVHGDGARRSPKRFLSREDNASQERPHDDVLVTLLGRIQSERCRTKGGGNNGGGGGNNGGGGGNNGGGGGNNGGVGGGDFDDDSDEEVQDCSDKDGQPGIPTDESDDWEALCSACAGEGTLVCCDG
jgi:hypothetical protein